MTVECTRCTKIIREEEKIIEYDQLPYHKSCIKQKYREDNPDLEPEKYREFDKRIQLVDKIKVSGNLIIPVAYEKPNTEEEDED